MLPAVREEFVARVAKLPTSHLLVAITWMQTGIMPMTPGVPPLPVIENISEKIAISDRAETLGILLREIDMRFPPPSLVERQMRPR